MKKHLLLFLGLGLGVVSFGQYAKAPISKELQNIAVPRSAAIVETDNLLANPESPYTKAVSEEEIGSTTYDLWSNSCTQNRLVFHADGTMGAVWTRGMEAPGYADRGTGYNYYDGSAWGDYPTERIESVKTGWPSYAPWGSNGEIVLSHIGGTSPMMVIKRASKGTGDWEENEMAAPAGAAGYLWPRMITSGEDHSKIHVLGLTTPTGNGGTAYNNMDGALLYSRSSDGGATWEIDAVQPPQLTSTEYTGLGGDTYAWAEPKNNTLAFVVGDNWYDLMLFKSTDGGDNWTKTIIWEHPYPLWNNVLTDTFYCPDGTFHVAIDNNDKCHVVFGVNRALGDADGGKFWYPFVDGVAYWNEDKPTWTGGTQEEQVEILNPELLDAAGDLIGYAIDVNENGTWDILEGGSEVMGNYYSSPSSMPQLHIDAQNNMFFLYSSVTEGFDNGTQNYRHIWARASEDGGETWVAGENEFVDLTSDFIHAYDECVFPTIAGLSSGDNFYYMFNADDEPGLSVRGDEDPPGDNRLVFQTVPKVDILPTIGINENQNNLSFVGQNYPNPAANYAMIDVSVNSRQNISLQVVNVLGQLIYSDQVTSVKGDYQFEIDVTSFDSGLYFYTVEAGNASVTKKMIIK